MAKGSFISWGGGTSNSDDYNDVADWNTTTAGLRIMSSITSDTNSPTQYATGLHVKGRYGFQLAANGIYSHKEFYIRGISSTPQSWLKLIHSGNIASQSVAYATNAGNADTLDGVHLSDIIMYATPSESAPVDLNDIRLRSPLHSVNFNAAQSMYLSNSPWGTNNAGHVWTLPGYWNLQIAKYHNSNDIRVRGGNYGNANGWTEWKQLAFTDSNVASATKLQTARTIWGQSFDGTRDITGTLTIPAIGGGDGRYIDMNCDGYYLHGGKGGWAMGMRAYLNDGTYKEQVCGAYGDASSLRYFYYGGEYNNSAMYITSSKNVGIGTNSPAYKLDVNGIIRTNGFIKQGSSNDYVLLGGGDHKAISDFLLKSELANQELNNNLTVIEKSLTVTADWMDTGITRNDLPSNGTYIV